MTAWIQKLDPALWSYLLLPHVSLDTSTCSQLTELQGHKLIKL